MSIVRGVVEVIVLATLFYLMGIVLAMLTEIMGGWCD